MRVHRIRRGLRLPVSGSPDLPIRGPVKVGKVGVLPDDYPGLRPRLLVDEGSRVRRGQCLFEDRNLPLVRVTSPASGRVVEVVRGPRRALSSVIVEVHEAEGEEVEAPTFDGGDTRSREQIVALLCESGLWTALRTRPFSRVPAPDAVPFAMFVTAIDTQPLAPDPQVVIDAAPEDFRAGLLAVCELTEGETYLCVAPGSRVADVDAPVEIEAFDGPHPAGLVGLHIHRLAPVSRQRVVWSVGYQDVIAIGRLLRTGSLDPERVISIAGPAVAHPRLVRTRLGASLPELTAADDFDAEVRLISGSMLSGKSMTKAHYGYLGRYDNQLTVLREHREREFLGWLKPGLRKPSLLPVFLSRWIGSRVDWSTTLSGAPRAMVPIGAYERVMPMDILPTFLLRALLVGDLERAEELGCLELDEEDLSLCSFVCPSKHDFGPILRQSLELLEKEGA